MSSRTPETRRIQRRTIQRAALAALVALVAASSGCTTLEVQSRHDERFDFTTLRTWAWMPGSGPRGDLGPVDPQLLDTEVRKAVERVLAGKGFAFQPTGTPDFMVGFHAAVRHQRTNDAMNEYYGYVGGFGSGGVRTRRVVEEYEEGSLVLDVSTDAGSRLVWRGGAQTRLMETATKAERTAGIHDAVEQILDSFPP